MARPKKHVDVELLKKHAAIHCTMDEMASLHEVSVDTLERRFADVIRDARVNGKMSLRRKQMEVALQGNVVMLKWLGIQLLGQSDRVEQRFSDRTANQNSEPDKLLEVLRAASTSKTNSLE